MNLVKDQDFKVAFGWSSLILIHLAFNIFGYFASQRQIDFGFVFFEIALFIFSLIILTSAIKISKTQGIGMKFIYGFVYSFVSTFFVIYKFTIESFYHIQFGGGDWGYLAVILGWPIYFIVSIPLLIIFKKNFSTHQNSQSNFYSILMALPTICGVTLLLFLTFTGRLIYKPIYEQKKLQIQKKLNVDPLRIEYQSPLYDTQCKCTRSVIKGSIKVLNSVNFPINLEIEPSYKQGVCQISANFLYLLKKGNEIKNFYCYVNEFDNLKVGNKRNIFYRLIFTEKENPGGVREERTYSINDFSEVINFK